MNMILGELILLEATNKSSSLATLLNPNSNLVLVLKSGDVSKPFGYSGAVRHSAQTKSATSSSEGRRSIPSPMVALGGGFVADTQQMGAPTRSSWPTPIAAQVAQQCQISYTQSVCRKSADSANVQLGQNRISCARIIVADQSMDAKVELDFIPPKIIEGKVAMNSKAFEEDSMVD